MPDELSGMADDLLERLGLREDKKDKAKKKKDKKSKRKTKE